MAISKDLLLSILSLDAYNRGYDAGIEGLEDDVGTNIGSASVKKRIQNVSDTFATDAEDVGFYAISYDTPFGTVISYRGTDRNVSLPWNDDPGSDLWSGYGIAAGSPGGEQARLAAEFYQSVTGTESADPRTGAATLTGHSLGGGLAGFIGGLYEN